MMMALTLFFILSTIASTFVIFAAVLSARLSDKETWTETYDNNIEANDNQSQPIPAQMSSQ